MVAKHHYRVPLHSEKFSGENRRSQKDVLRKIASKYDLKPGQYELTEQECHETTDYVQAYIKSEAFQERLQKSCAVNHLSLTNNQRAELGHIMEDFALSCHRIAKLRPAACMNMVKNKLEPGADGIVPDYENLEHLVDIYSGHVLQEALSRVKTLGFTKDNDDGTISLAGGMIHELSQRVGVRMEPVRPRVFSSPQAREAWKDEVRGGHADKAREKLKASHRRAREGSAEL